MSLIPRLQEYYEDKKRERIRGMTREGVQWYGMLYIYRRHKETKEVSIKIIREF